MACINRAWVGLISISKHPIRNSPFLFLLSFVVAFCFDYLQLNVHTMAHQDIIVLLEGNVEGVMDRPPEGDDRLESERQKW